jgi:hypothetical protein
MSKIDAYDIAEAEARAHKPRRSHKQRRKQWFKPKEPVYDSYKRDLAEMRGEKWPS